jgi:hypothetical protein
VTSRHRCRARSAAAGHFTARPGAADRSFRIGSRIATPHSALLIVSSPLSERSSIMFHRIALPFAVLALFVVAATTLSSSPPSDLMEKKTERAQSILRNLALGDLAAVERDAAAIEKLTTDAGFGGKGEEYADYGNEFLRITRELKHEAGRKNLAGAYYQFTRMTAVCFSCHQHLRDARD